MCLQSKEAPFFLILPAEAVRSRSYSLQNPQQYCFLVVERMKLC